VVICANANGYWGGYLGGVPGVGPRTNSANTGTFVAQATTSGGPIYPKGTLLEWLPNNSGLPENLFKPHCVVEVSVNGTDSFLSWPFGGTGGGTCTLGPLPAVIPPHGQPPEMVQLTIPNQPPQKVGISTEAASQDQTNTYLTAASGEAVFTTLDPI
jgi:hypothetical protein